MIFLSVCQLFGAPLAAQEMPNWSAIAQADIEAAYEILRTNHPGMHDPKNPGFAAQLAEARSAAIARTAKVVSPGGYVAAVQSFTTALQDGHVGMRVEFRPPLENQVLRWPGFYSAWRGRDLYVFQSSGNEPAVGARIVECDGRTPQALVEANVFAFVGRRHEAGQWWFRAPMALVETGNPFVTVPRRCTFESNGRSATRDLAWSDLSEDRYNALRRLSANGERLEIGLSEPLPGVFWIALPDFAPDAAGRERYQRLFEDLSASRKALLSARAVVVDLRHNNGGSSQWPNDVAEALWGKQAVGDATATHFKHASTWWRATEGNTRYLEDLIEVLRKSGDDAIVKEVTPVAQAMRAALNRNEVFAKTSNAENLPTTRIPSELKVPLFVVVPGQCASACLDALDIFTLFDNTILIGAPSSADTTYMEVRSEPLPPHHSAPQLKTSVVLPIKIWVDRPRASGEVYMPDIEVTDLEWSVKDFLSHIERELGRYRPASQSR